jgi:hypothetical protein
VTGLTGKLNSISAAINRVSYKKIAWIPAITETIHNIEEAIWLPAWSADAGLWNGHVTADQFRFAVAAVTLLVYAIIYYYTRNGNNFSTRLYCGTLVIIFVNVFVPHLAASVITASYSPGVLSGIILNVPVTLYLLRSGLREKLFTYSTIASGTALTAVIMLLVIALSFFAAGLLPV